MPKIVLVNPPENGPFTEDVIGNLLQKQPVTACHGSEFTGRPVTKLIVDAKSVVKLRTEYSLGELQASRFAEKAIEKERNLNVHHPHKTWFLYFEPNDKEQSSDVVIGNITPKLQPLHSDSAQQTLGGESLLKLLSHLLEMYLNAARYDDARLDLCLSNFGVDDSGALFYLDDDFYTWDEFGFLPHFLGTLIRSQDWLTSDYMERLGLYLRDGILDRFQDPHWLTVIAEELRNVFVPEQRQSLRIALVNALN
ncbi:hypothetical protein, partial [Kaarinaea lacus]